MIDLVSLHGKWENPYQHINNLAASLKSKGYNTIIPLMLWSKLKGYDSGYTATFKIVDNNVRELKNKA